MTAVAAVAAAGRIRPALAVAVTAISAVILSGASAVVLEPSVPSAKPPIGEVSKEPYAGVPDAGAGAGTAASGSSTRGLNPSIAVRPCLSRKCLRSSRAIDPFQRWIGFDHKTRLRGNGLERFVLQKMPKYQIHAPRCCQNLHL